MSSGSASVSTSPSSMAEKKIRSPFSSIRWMARTWWRPPTRTTTGWAAKVKVVSCSGSLPSRRAYSRAAGSALIAAHDAARRVGPGHHHAPIRRHQMIQAEHLDPAGRAHHAVTTAALLRRRALRKAQGRRQSAVPSPADPPNSGTGPKPRPQRRRQLVFAHRKAVDHQKGELGLPARAAPAPAPAAPGSVARSGPARRSHPGPAPPAPRRQKALAGRPTATISPSA